MLPKSTPTSLSTKPQLPSELGVGAISLTANQLREVLEFANPDGADDLDQSGTEVTITQRAAFTSTDGDAMPAGLYVHLTEYPEEGVYGPLGVDLPLSA